MFKQDRLGSLPKQSEMHHLADYMELLCLTDPDGEYGVERLGEKYLFATDLQEVSPDAQDSDDIDIIERLAGIDVEDEPEEPQTDEDASELEDLLEYEAFGRDAELRDVRDRWCWDVFALLIHRSEVCADNYPFTVNVDERSISLRDATPERLFYTYLLLCSSLRYVPKRVEGKLTKSFERVSADVLRGLLPDRAVVDVFGTARGKDKSQFSGTLYKRIGRLAKTLGGRRIVSAKDFHPRDTADNGLDIAAWIPLPGGREGQPTFFGQCACGTGWRGKQHEADYGTRWKDFIHLTSPPTTITFIPYFFRKPGGHWYARADVNTIVIDRMRMMMLAAETEVPMTSVPFDLAYAARAYQGEQVST